VTGELESESPCDLAIDVALNLFPRRAGETIFRVLVVQEILPNQGEFQPGGGLPATRRSSSK